MILKPIIRILFKTKYIILYIKIQLFKLKGDHNLLCQRQKIQAWP